MTLSNILRYVCVRYVEVDVGVRENVVGATTPHNTPSLYYDDDDSIYIMCSHSPPPPTHNGLWTKISEPRQKEILLHIHTHWENFLLDEGTLTVNYEIHLNQDIVMMMKSIHSP